MQSKDIPDVPILEFLDKRVDKDWDNGGGLAFWYGLEAAGERSIAHAMPPGTPDKLRIAKMARLIGRGLVNGCGCGCRGDYEITTKGRSYLRKSMSTEPTNPVKMVE